MTRAEVLSEIKQAEENAKVMVVEATEAKNRKISDARVQSREIIRKAEEEAAQSSESEIEKARKKIQKEKEKIIEKGALDAQEIKQKAKKNITKAVKLILTDFERAVNA